ncbi:MAG: hypothetical protein ACKN9E_02745 [Microcystaceae cyanobacterium]
MKWRKYIKGLGIGAGIAFLLLVTHRAAPRKAVENDQMKGVWLTNIEITSVLTGKTAIALTFLCYPSKKENPLISSLLLPKITIGMITDE